MGSAMGQHVLAFGGGDADATLTNSGSITIVGMANASGNAAFAAGEVFGGLRQSATATGQYATITTFGGGTGTYTPGGNANASLTNSGKIMVVGHANAVGTTGAASAVALVGGGLVQSAKAPNGAASATLVNTGSFTAAAVASAVGAKTAHANATASGGLVQEVVAGSGNATGSITNGGSIESSPRRSPRARAVSERSLMSLERERRLTQSPSIMPTRSLRPQSTWRGGPGG